MAYVRLKDIRYPIITVTAAKLGKKLLLLSPHPSIDTQGHLIRTSDCGTFLHAKGFDSVVDNVLSRIPENTATSLQMPDLRLPKLVTYTHQMMASLDSAELMPDAHEETMNRHFANMRWYTPLPSLHFVGMTVALQFPVVFGTVVVVGPTIGGPLGPALASDTLRWSRAQGVMFPPALVDAMCGDPYGLECQRGLDHLYFAGVPLARRSAEKFLSHVSIKPGMGSTEAGDLHKAVFVRNPSVERWQQVFQVYPHLDRFPTHDLFSKHPSKPGFWKCVGRTDDVVPLSHGENLCVADMGAEIAAALPEISAVLIGGQGKPKPFLLVEWKENELDEKSKMDQLLPILEHANRGCSDLVKLSPGFLWFTDPSRKLVRTAKGSVSRRESE
ncbi:hypothetical protein K458DRAFT_426014 [Lentithecium fluviatile CBS 122367]|uniref:Acetyl-CoA synthetase-like protein n=1 Tax=Lentithecium fluviatile CBS 122367 TaxID=1168545 RepID=A0A6G1JNW8_9PLEO|nr:hypothetical protein K458DRAFT_426014 [Lentithecium fluviatile CBS 122367]